MLPPSLCRASAEDACVSPGTYSHAREDSRVSSTRASEVSKNNGLVGVFQAHRPDAARPNRHRPNGPVQFGGTAFSTPPPSVPNQISLFERPNNAVPFREAPESTSVHLMPSKRSMKPNTEGKLVRPVM